MNLTGLLQERWKMPFIFNVTYKSTDYKYHFIKPTYRRYNDEELKNLLYEPLAQQAIGPSPLCQRGGNI